MTNMDAQDERTRGQKMKQGCSNFGKFLYRKGLDKDGNEVGLVIGRSSSSWARIGLFYLCFYGFLAGFFAAMLIVFLTTINPETNKGPGANAGPKLIQFLADNELDVAPGLNWVNKIPIKKEDRNEGKFKNITKSYIDGFSYVNHVGVVDCPLDVEEGKNTKEIPCKPALNFTQICNDTDSFGYQTATPCLFIRINKVWGWVPLPDGSMVLKLQCDGATVLNGGYQKSAFPFVGQKDFQTPPAVIRVDVGAAAKTIKCMLVGKGVVPSDSYKASRAFGKIILEVPKLP